MTNLQNHFTALASHVFWGVQGSQALAKSNSLLDNPSHGISRAFSTPLNSPIIFLWFKAKVSKVNQPHIRNFLILATASYYQSSIFCTQYHQMEVELSMSEMR